MCPVTASKLYKLSEVLDVPVSFFFDDAAEVKVPNHGVMGWTAPAQSFLP
jgi:transcriptional regulator with XRE-family HTH domain